MDTVGNTNSHTVERKSLNGIYCLLKILSILFLVASQGYCQSKNDSAHNINHPKYLRSYFLHLSSGWGGDKSAFQLKGAAQLSEKIILGFGIIGTSAPTSFLTVEPNSHSVDSYFLQIGTTYKYKHAMVKWGIGPTLNKVYTYSNDTGLFGPTPKIKNDVAGILLEGEAILGGKVLGLSVSSFVNLNNEFTYAGLTIGCVIGRLIVKRK